MRVDGTTSGKFENRTTKFERNSKSQTANADSDSESTKAWSLKHIHRLIVNSATYKQSSKVTPELTIAILTIDCSLAARVSASDAEIVRDIALAASGLLNPKIGGPSIFTPAPRFHFPTARELRAVSLARSEPGPRRYRRAIYTFRRRSTPYPMLQAFDTPNGDYSCVRRLRSNTPLQALAT